MLQLINWIKQLRSKKELKRSNYGRDFNWFIEYKGEIIGELTDCRSVDMFWDSYTIKATNKKWRKVLSCSEYWCYFKYKNQYYEQYANSAVSEMKRSPINLEERIKIRGLYLTTLNS